MAENCTGHGARLSRDYWRFQCAGPLRCRRLRSDRMSILRQSFGVFLTRIWGAAVGLAVSIIVARTLGPEGKGIYSLLLLVPSLLVTFGNGGLQVSNIY